MGTPADQICRQMSAAFKRGTPFACLVPSDLVDRICVNHAGELQPSQRMQHMLNANLSLLTNVRKFQYTASDGGLVIHNLQKRKRKQKCNGGSNLRVGASRPSRGFLRLRFCFRFRFN